MAADDMSMLDLSDDPKPVGKKEEKKSFFDSAMDKIPENAFKKGSPIGSKGKSQPPSKAEAVKAKEESPIEKERKANIFLHNSYLRNELTLKHLHASGYKCQMLPPNCDADTAKSFLDQVEMIMAGHQATRLATKMMQGLNKGVEFVYPDLKFGPISLSEAFNSAIEMESEIPNQMQLNMAELGIRLQPYLTTGFWPRFFMDYGSFVIEVMEYKKKGINPYKKQEQQGGEKEYHAFSNLDDKFNSTDL